MASKSKKPQKAKEILVPNNSFEVICDLLECITDYAITINPPQEDTKRYVIKSHTPQEKLDAIIKILFGENIEHVWIKVGNRSFLQDDMKLMQKLIDEMERTGQSKEKLIDDYVPHAKRRSDNTEDESIRSRLEDVYYYLRKKDKEEKEHPIKNYDYSEYLESDLPDYVTDELLILAPWLKKYRTQLINFLDK